MTDDKTQPPVETSPIWGGRFATGPDKIMEAINASIDFDQRMYAQDISASMAHAKMLADKEIISAADADTILSGLETIRDEIERGDFKFSRVLEDIHMNIENRLSTLIGDVGRLHAVPGDQVATDFRLWVRDALDSWTGTDGPKPRFCDRPTPMLVL